MKNLTEIKGDINEVKGKIKQQYAILTDNGLLLVDGKQDEMLGHLQSKLGKVKKATKALISKL